MRLFIDTGSVTEVVLRQMLAHPLTAAGIETFERDWRSRPQFAEWLAGLVRRGQLPV